MPVTDLPFSYKMTLSLNIYKHLGVGLYSNTPSVLSEVVANAWDADAEHVEIRVDDTNGRISIRDDGIGMSPQDTNDKYLYIGYERRTKEGRSTTPKGRRVMGRKGIGKLSLFSIAKTIEIHSKTEDGQPHGFVMKVDTIEEKLKSGSDYDYKPDPVAVPDGMKRGTTILISDMKRDLAKTVKALRKRLARRFCIIGSGQRFELTVDGVPVTIADRDYGNRLEYVWTFGERDELTPSSNVIKECFTRPGTTEEPEYEIGGWIGTAEKSGKLTDSDTDESINKIIVMVRDKLALEDILKDFAEGGIYTKYVMGEIRADFLDIDDKDDISTPDRQRILEEDPRYGVLKNKVQSELKHVKNAWTDLRNAGGKKIALTIPGIKKWYGSLTPDHKDAAKKLFGRINRMLIDDVDTKRQLFVSNILAFENLKLRGLLSRLDKIDIANMDDVGDVFIKLEELEATAYYQITKERMAVIRKLNENVESNAKEKVIQKFLFKNLWLLDPSWERATKTEVMERRVERAFRKETKSLTEKQRASRLDIKYTTTGNRHVIIELKRPDVSVKTSELIDQIGKYRGAVIKVLAKLKRSHEPVEFVCVLGENPRDWKDYDMAEHEGRKSLEAIHARVVLYDELINNAQAAYSDYTKSDKNMTPLHELIASITETDAATLSEQEPADQGPPGEDGAAVP